MEFLEFGTAVRDITPRIPMWAYGYSARTRKSSGVKEPLSLGCLAIRKGKERVLLFTLDMIGIRMEVCADLYALMEREVGIGYPHVMFSCSHTHFAAALQSTAFTDPEIGVVEPDQAHVEAVKARLVEAAREALENLQPLRLETARIRAPQVLFNRRTVRKDNGMVQMNLIFPDDASPFRFSPVDEEMTLVRLVDDSGIRGVLANFGCHPVTGSSPEEDYYRFSADYPYYLRQTITDTWHCPVFFTLGAAGDAVPINRKGDCRERIGNILGHSTILAERLFRTDASSALAADAVELEVKTILETDASAAESECEAARRALREAGKQNDGYKSLAETYQQKSLALTRARLYPKNRGTIPLQFLRLGKTTLIGMPFEVLSEIGLKIKAQHPDSIVVSCCGGYQGYLPLAYEYDRGGYEATASSTHFVPGTGDRILDAILEKLGQGFS